MRTHLQSNLARILLVTLPFLLMAADCGDQTGTAEDANLFFSARGFSLPADGVSTLDIVVAARDANGDPDNSAITVSVDGGTLTLPEGATGEVSPDGLSLTATPASGQVRYSYLCPRDLASTTAMVASNGTVERTQNIFCSAPVGTYELRLDAGDCQTNRIVADGESSCEVLASVVLVAPTGEFPREGIRLTVNVDSATAVTGGLPADDLVLSDDDNNNNLRRTLQIDTDADGVASFFIHSPELTLEQTMVISINGTDGTGAALPEQTLTSTIRPFNNQANLTLVAAQSSVIGGEATFLTLTATNQAGQPAAGDTVFVELVAPGGQAALVVGGGDAGVASGNTLEVTLDENGEARIDLETEEVDILVPVSVTATYQPIEVLPAITDSVNISINPAGALIVNAVVAPATIQSDLGETTTVTVTVEKEGSALQGANVRFVVGSNDTDRIGLGALPNLVSASNVLTNVDGIATIQVSPTTDRVRGAASVLVTVSDDDPESADVVQTVTFNIERAPILQSIVFVSATPNVIGVRGSSAPSSSTIQFQVLDDSSRPMPGVRVSFDVNATADPGASVGGAEFSDASGLVSVVLAAGTQAGPITVVATAQTGNVQLVVESAPIAVVGGLPAFAQSFLVCDLRDSVGDREFQEDCTAVVADRFTARSGLNQILQFRAEGGTVTPSVETFDGIAPFSFQPSEPYEVRADVFGWSYGSALPLSPGALDATGDNNGDGAVFDIAPCYDGASGTGCNLLALCTDDDAASNNDLYCPLPTNAAGNCWDRLTAENMDTIFNPPSEVEYILDVGERAKVDDVMSKLNVCGFALSCLAGKTDLFPYMEGDECPAAGGCFDFTGVTRCPQSGLVTIMATTRGEESFVDLNGNGVFDFQDDDGDGAHDVDELALEPFVDMPEPFLDKNGSCSRDDFSNSFRMSPFQEFVNTDPFSDEDGSGDFGYINPANPDGARLLTNGRFDRDKEIFMTTHAVRLAGVNGSTGEVVGEVCNNPGGTHTCVASGFVAACIEYAPDVALAPACFLQQAVYPEGTTIPVGFAYVDANGNCVDRERETSIGIEVSGPFRENGTSTNVSMFCGIGPNGQGIRNPLKPWCEELPNLGAGLIQFNLTTQCGPEEFDIVTGSMSRGVTGLVSGTTSTTFAVQCPPET